MGPTKSWSHEEWTGIGWSSGLCVCNTWDVWGVGLTTVMGDLRTIPQPQTQRRMYLLLLLLAMRTRHH